MSGLYMSSCFTRLGLYSASATDQISRASSWLNHSELSVDESSSTGTFENAKFWSLVQLLPIPGNNLYKSIADVSALQTHLKMDYPSHTLCRYLNIYSTNWPFFGRYKFIILTLNTSSSYRLLQKPVQWPFCLFTRPVISTQIPILLPPPITAHLPNLANHSLPWKYLIIWLHKTFYLTSSGPRFKVISKKCRQFF